MAYLYETASRLLPLRARLSMGLQTHLHLHAKFQSSYSDIARQRKDQKAAKIGISAKRISKTGLQGIVESLAGAVRRLKPAQYDTEWANYYDETNYSDTASLAKRELVEKFLVEINGPLNIIQDLGSNTGEFSRIAAKYAKLAISQDIDPVAVEKNYLHLKQEGSATNVLPLLQDLGAPATSPPI